MSSAPLTGQDDPDEGVAPAVQDHSLTALLRLVTFRRLWISMGISSFGDWLGLLATTAMAYTLAGGTSGDGGGWLSGAGAGSVAMSGVLVLRLAPAIVAAPLGGLIADRLDRRTTMVVGDLIRGALFVTVPLVGELWWLYAATVLIEFVGLVWMPAKDASIPNLVPARRLEAANQLNMATTYGSAPLAALVYILLSLIGGGLGRAVDDAGGPIALALYVDAGTYFVAAAVVSTLAIPTPHGATNRRTESAWRALTGGWAYITGTPVIRGLTLGMLGGIGAAGAVMGLAPAFVTSLGGGQAGYGVLFCSVFVGLALGMLLGPRLLRQLSRRRVFGLALTVAGVFLALVGLVHNMVFVALLVVLLGSGAGLAWVTGYTLIGAESADAVRGRVFSFINAAARIVLVGVMALAPLVSVVLGDRVVHFTRFTTLTYSGAALALLLAGLLAAALGVVSYRQMDDRPGVSLAGDLLRAWRARDFARFDVTGGARRGLFVAVEGGDGVGKTTQIAALADWLGTDPGREVVVTREPGGTALGTTIRGLVLTANVPGAPLSARAEALLFAADRAQHVEEVIRPALDRGAIVVTDRYVDSTLAYQAGGRELSRDDLIRLSAWATSDLVPDLTVLLDADPGTAGIRRAGRAGADPAGRAGADRMEREDDGFHARVRETFLDLARSAPERYLVVDAGRPVDEVQAAVRSGLTPLLDRLGSRVGSRS